MTTDQRLRGLIVFRGRPYELTGRQLTAWEAVEVRRQLVAELAAAANDTDDEGADPCSTDRCFLDDGHDGRHRYYAHPSDDPWQPHVIAHRREGVTLRDGSIGYFCGYCSSRAEDYVTWPCSQADGGES